MLPTTHYATSHDGLNIAYQVVGDGDLDILFVPGFVSHLDLWWSRREVASWLQRLSSIGRTILFDKLGTGMSDPTPGIRSLEDRTRDMRSVLDAVGSQRCALFGISEGGPASMLFTARYPDRVTALVLYGTFAAFGLTDDYQPVAEAEIDRVRRWMAYMRAHWGEGRSAEVFWPSLTVRRPDVLAWGTLERASASPGMVAAILDAVEQVDARVAMQALDVPTLVMHRTDDQAVPVELGRYLAEHIEGARFVEFPGHDHIMWGGDPDEILDATEEFLTGRRPRREARRVLVTVLFTDIVESTSHVADVGDEAWTQHRQQLTAHLAAAAAVNGGRIVKDLGDGHLTEFPGPAAAIATARAAKRAARDLGLRLRAGVHTGECERDGDDLSGLAVNIGARIVEAAQPDQILVSGTVPGLTAGSGLSFEERGVHELRGVPGSWSLFAVVDEDEPARAPLDPPGATLRPADRLLLESFRRAPETFRRTGRAVFGRES